MIPDFDLAQLPIVNIAASLAIILLMLLIRLAAGHAIRSRTRAAPHQQRRWEANIRNLLFFLALVGLVLIWAPQLRTFALSLTAVAVALVLATKELILCFSGSFMRTSSRAFSVGDWIEIGGIRGEVVDHSVFVTTLHEFEPGSFSYAGRTAVVPNSAFLGQPMRNDSLMRDHIHLCFSLTVDPAIDVFAERGAIEEMVSRRYASGSKEGTRADAALKERLGVNLPDDAVQFSFRTTDLGRYRIDIGLVCPTRLADSLQNDITCEVMSYLHRRARRQRPEEAASEGQTDGAAREEGASSRA